MQTLKKYLTYEVFTSKKLLFYASIGSGKYLVISSLLYLRRYSREKNETNKIISFLNKEKEKNGNIDYGKLSQKEKSEMCFYYLFITMKKFYSKQFSEFDMHRRSYLENSSNLKKYISCVEKFHKMMKVEDQKIFEFILKSLNFNGHEVDKVIDQLDKE